MKFFNWNRDKQSNQENMAKGQVVRMFTNAENESYYAWNGNIYQNDIVRAAIRAKSKVVGKAVAKHIRADKVNPEPYMKLLLQEPNALMSMQQMLEKTITQLELNNNAYIFVDRDDMGYPIGLYPIVATSVQAMTNKRNELFLQFTLKKNGQIVTFNYRDVIHLRQDFNESEIFGDSNYEALVGLMEVVTTVDKGVMKAIKNSNIIQWLLSFNANMRPEDLEKSVESFRKSFLDIETGVGGVAGVDNKSEAKQVTNQSIMPDKELQKENAKRVYNYFGVNEKIINASYNENEWIAFYESSIEPLLIQLSNEFSRKLFTRKERSFGNWIIFEGANLAFASMSTKLALVGLVDRAVMNPNELREILNMSPVPHGDEYLLRKDTGTAKEERTEVQTTQPNNGTKVKSTKGGEK